MKKYILLFALGTALLHSGCVVGRRTVALPVPALGDGGGSKGALRIASVVDNRAFQNKPAEPSTPSIDGDVTAISPEQKIFDDRKTEKWLWKSDGGHSSSEW